MKTVIEMAREAGAGEPESLYGRTDYVVMTKFELERFAEIVRADEREACADLCYQLVDNSRETRFATAIRARRSHDLVDVPDRLCPHCRVCVGVLKESTL